MASLRSTLPPVLLGMTAITGVVDAVSFLALGHVFTANMTGNVVFLGFAIAGAPGLSIGRSLAAMSTFMLGAAVGGRILARAGAGASRASMTVFALEVVILAVAAGAALGYGPEAPSSPQGYALIALTATAMGLRNSAVRKLGVPDLTTTVLTLTVTGLAADSSLAGGDNPRWGRRVASIVAMFAGAAAGALLVRESVFVALVVVVVASAGCHVALRMASADPVDDERGGKAG